jgi:hypothetical protein
MSVVVIDAVERVSSEGVKFTALIVQSNLEIVRSYKGNLYCTVRKASLPSTLDLEVARQTVIGKELPGTVERKECAEYETVNSDGEVILLNHRWEYVPEEIRTDVPEKQLVSLEELEPETV